jgi:hypothetical protein
MDADDVPAINRSSQPHGSPATPHVVASASSLLCRECGLHLGAVLLDRLVAASERAKEVSGG